MEIIKGWNNQIINLDKKTANYKEIKTCFDNALDLSENQRKAIKLLRKIVEKNEKMHEIQKRK